MESSRRMTLIGLCCLFALAMFADARPVLATSERQNGSVLAGYTFGTNVQEHSEIDLDVEEMEMNTDTFDFEAAETIYSMGANSKKTNELRTLKGFSTDLPNLLEDDDFFDLYKDYWGSSTWADDFVMNALNANGDFADASDIMRAECALKGAQYQNVWMYVYRELADAIKDCNASTPMDNDDAAVTAWDEAWAFYAGSEEGSDGSGTGFLIYALAEKRCQDFGTCSGGSAPINSEILNLFKDGQEVLNVDEPVCSDLEPIVESIRERMVIPVLQGVLRYVWLADPDSPDGGSDKAWAEGWAFSAAILPVIKQCDADVAATLERNFKVTNDGPMTDGSEAVSKEIFSILGCLGATCNDIGDLQIDGEMVIECVEASDDDEDDGVCFPADATVEVEGGQMIRMDELEVGQKVRTASGEFSEVHMFGHRETERSFTFKKLEVEVAGQQLALDVSGNHFVRANGGMVLARDLVVGDAVESVHGPGKIVRISQTQKVGLISPVTLNGEMTVNDIVVSCFSSALHPSLASWLLIPVRLVYRLFSWNMVGTMMHHPMAHVARSLGLPKGVSH